MKLAQPVSGWNCLKVLPLTLGFLSLTLLSPALAQEKMLRTLTVSGRGTENVATSLTLVRLGVEAQGKTADAAQQEAASRSSAVVALLRSRKVDKLETTGINLNPNYRYDNGKQTLIGYIASNTVSFRIATEKAGPLLDEAVKAGATRIDGVSFIATDEAIAVAQKQALREATTEAQQQADVVLGALNLTRKEVVSIQVNGAFAPPPPVPVNYKFAAPQAEAASTPVVGGEQQVEASVTLQISY
ncbi:MAG: SIMPL domain-containing protein [Scytolyngbya sp. HA4215-MV1]|nr:SIMPL domain-containing protein [Scytolyngbya sp. HA4215-MV1]